MGNKEMMDGVLLNLCSQMAIKFEHSFLILYPPPFAKGG